MLGPRRGTAFNSGQMYYLPKDTPLWRKIPPFSPHVSMGFPPHLTCVSKEFYYKLIKGGCHTGPGTWRHALLVTEGHTPQGSFVANSSHRNAATGPCKIRKTCHASRNCHMPKHHAPITGQDEEVTTAVSITSQDRSHPSPHISTIALGADNIP